MKPIVWAVFLAILSQSVLAANCIISATATSFGTYDVFSAVANDNGVGRLSVDCSGAAGTVTLSPGRSHTFTSRELRSGANRLAYNLYNNAARTAIWGDGSGGSSVMPVLKNTAPTFSVYGRIPAGQDAAMGLYSDNITATVNF